MCTGLARFVHVPALLQGYECGDVTALDVIDGNTLPVEPDAEEPRGRAAPREEDLETEGYTRSRGTQWSKPMLDLMKVVFAEEMMDKRRPITKEKAQECVKKMADEGYAVTVAAVRAKATRARKAL